MDRIDDFNGQLKDILEKLREAEASSARGESRELDVERFIAEVSAELAQEGIHLD